MDQGRQQENTGSVGPAPGVPGGQARRGRPVGQMLYGLREARIRADLTGGKLAEKAGVHENTIRRLENLHTGADPRTVRRLSRALEVEPRRLLEERDEDLPAGGP